MKQAMIIGIVTLLFAAAAGAETVPPTIGGLTFVPRGQVEETGQFGYVELARITADDTVMADTDKTWYGVLTSARWVRIPRQFSNFVCVNVYAHGQDVNDPNAGTIDVNCFVNRQYGGAVTVFKATFAIGDEELSHDPNSGAKLRADGAATNDPNSKWADTATITVGSGDYEWPTDVLKSGYVGGELHGNMAGVWFKPLGAQFIRVEGSNGSWTDVDRYVIVMTGG